ncbi:hybrid sensor histidine kinase/response regulator [Chitinasiproducens palmae]|uniref:histidine kinase n=1 Tax=Chitinasiproducens palmae TaxID=1770053 RepID=A0A1H2PK68_9BURK|nr:PAS domain S-box protein [Chitinasiproducens palmae]SDV46765.1 PAS domain S-box-containing protein [Chitinasiproducens palmae]
MDEAQLRSRLAALEAENARLRAGTAPGRAEICALLEAVKDHAIVVIDLDGIVVEWGEGARAVFGWTRDAMLGESLARVFTPEDQAAGRPRDEIAEALREGRAPDERWHVRADGSRFWACGEMRPLRDQTGRVVGLVKSLSDRTEARHTSQELRASESRYQTLFEAIDAGFCVVEMKFDETGKASDYLFLETNPAFEIQTGLRNAAGHWMRELAPEHEEHWFRTYGDVALTGKPARFENVAEALGRWYDVHALRIGDPAKRHVAILFNDISNRRRAELALQRLTESLQQEVETRTRDRNQLWELSTDIMLRCRLDGRILAVNPAWADTLGWTESQLIGANILDLIHPDDIKATRDAMTYCKRGEALSRFENRYRTRGGGYRWIDWSARAADEVLNAVGRDISEDKERIAALERAEAQLRQSQKMEAVGQLTGGLAHDFNNLLTSITGSLDLLQARLDQGRQDEASRYIGTAQSAASRAAALTHRLLAFSRRQTLDPKPTDVNRLVAGMEDIVRRTVGPAIELTVSADPGLWPTLVDPNQLENALLNLCINARDAMPGGGRLTVETANRWLDAKAAGTFDVAPGQYIALSVSDTGAGMTADVAAKAFDPFFTTKPLGMGTGLGLSMIYGFARQTGGQVRIYSEPGQGTTVSLYLPRHRYDEAIVHGVAAVAPVTPAGQGETVLVVDDEPAIRMVITETLQDLGYHALEATDGAGGLSILNSDAHIDLLVTDVGLPGGMNGRQMADAARVRRPTLKVLFITGYAENAVVGNGNLDPGMHVMSKPFAIDSLAVRIKQLIDSP